MNIFRRVLSAGGWVAHNSNQFAGPVDFADHDSTIKPIFIFVDMALPGLLVLALTLTLLGFLPQSPGAPDRVQTVLVALPLIAVSLALIAWLAYGWISGFVPFVPDPASSQVLNAEVLEEDQPMRLGLTGIVALPIPTIRRRYRNRPTALVIKDGEINLLVYRWRYAFTHKQNSFAAIVSLDPRSISDVVRGTAFLVTKELPAISAHTPQGRLLMTFGQATSRDKAYNTLVTQMATA